MFILIIKRIFLFTLLAAGLWFGYIKFYQPNFHSVIKDKYYRSAQLNASTLDSYIAKHKIATIINLRGSNPKKEWYQQEKQIADKNKVDHFDIKLAGHKLPKIHQVIQLIDLLQSKPTPILFHCNGGSDRAGLTAALVKLLDPRFTLEEINKEASWRYRAFSDMSTGKLFLKQYHQWLDKTQIEHTPKVFKQWLHNYYIDDSGNQITVYGVYQKKKWLPIIKPGNKATRKVKVTRETKNVYIIGRTIDYSNQSVPQNIEITLSQKPVTSFKKGLSRPYMAKKYGNEAFLPSGWQAIQRIADLEDGCHDLRFEYTTLNYKKWLSPPKVQVCIE